MRLLSSAFEQDFTDSSCEESDSTNCYSVSSTSDEVSSDDENCGDKVIFSSSFSFFFVFCVNFEGLTADL